MEVLLVGNGRMTEALIDRLNKNGDRVYLLTGQREGKSSHRHVFEKYNFSYEDDSIKEVFKSVKPDITIFTGAWDSQFDWQKAEQESTRYTTSLINIVTAYSLLQKGRFVYFSSHEVFSGSNPQNLPESSPTSPKDFRGMALSQGEEICTNYHRNQGLDIRIIRFDHLYCVPEKEHFEMDPCFAMCLEALRSGRISANSREVFSMIFLKDAVELAYKIIAAPKLNQSLYHISSMEEINGMQLAELVQASIGKNTQIMDRSVGERHRLILDSSAYQEELEMKIFTPYWMGVKLVAQYMRQHSESFIRAEDAGGNRWVRLWHRTKLIFSALVPYVENIVCFLIFFFLNSVAAGSDFFQRLDFFLLYVLLFAVIHGQKQSILSGLLAVAGFCMQEMYTRSGFEVMLDYNTYVWIAQLFIVGLVVGYLKDQVYTVQQESQDEIDYLGKRLTDIVEINDSNVRMKQNFEAQLVNQKDSLGKIYDITSTLEQQAPEEVLFTAVQMLARLMDCESAAVYTVANRSYARLFSSTSSEARSLGNSIEYTNMTEMYSELKERRVYINKTMENKLPLMASAVYHEDSMQLIFMLWGIPWQRMTMAEANRLAVIGQMVQSAVVRANRYLEALSNQRYVEGTRLMAANAFRQLADAFLRAQEKGLTECVLLEVETDGDCVSAASALGGYTRQSDYMGSVKEGILHVLLSNTNRENASFVMNRFRSAGYESRLVREVVW